MLFTLDLILRKQQQQQGERGDSQGTILLGSTSSPDPRPRGDGASPEAFLSKPSAGPISAALFRLNSEKLHRLAPAEHLTSATLRSEVPGEGTPAPGCADVKPCIGDESTACPEQGNRASTETYSHCWHLLGAFMFPAVVFI